jgi:SAM-dependent methyltransferase
MTSSRQTDAPALRFRAARELAYRVIVPVLRAGNRLGRTVGSLTHLFQLKVEGALRPQGEWYDHYVDANWQWGATGRSSFLERGVFNNLVMKPDAVLLELCCGDGFFTRHFYAGRAGRVVAVDANAEALAHARRHNAADNIVYLSCDIRSGLPEGPFDNVVWDSALHHFTKEEIGQILGELKQRLAPQGVLSGYTEVEDIPYAYRKVDFREKADVAELLGRAFRHVMVLETPDPARTNLYFFASDSKERLPLDQHNPAVLVRSTTGHQEGRSHLGGSRHRSDVRAG